MIVMGEVWCLFYNVKCYWRGWWGFIVEREVVLSGNDWGLL